jgi:hypothetical protein
VGDDTAAQRRGAEQECRQVAYFRSMMETDNATRPRTNYRVEMFKSLGHTFHDFASGTVYLPEDHPEWKNKNGNPVRTLRPHKVDPPQWAIDELKRAEEFCEAISKGEQ